MSHAEFIRMQLVKSSEAEGVIGELSRVPAHCRHINQPQPPQYLMGNPIQLKKLIQHVQDNGRDALGRRLKAKANVAIFGVASLPLIMADIANSPKLQAASIDWTNKTMNFLKARFGTALRLVAIHTDEKMYHLHFGVVPDLQPGTNRVIMANLHPGIQARDLIPKTAHKAYYLRDKAFRKAMRDFRADYATAVPIEAYPLPELPQAKVTGLKNSRYRKAKAALDAQELALKANIAAFAPRQAAVAKREAAIALAESENEESVRRTAKYMAELEQQSLARIRQASADFDAEIIRKKKAFSEVAKGIQQEQELLLRELAALVRSERERLAHHQAGTLNKAEAAYFNLT